MTKQEAISFIRNIEIECEQCPYYGECDNDFLLCVDAKDIAIECIEKCEHLIDDTLEMVSEYIDDCICTYDAELFGKEIKMIPVETVHQLLERIGEEAKGSDNE